MFARALMGAAVVLTAACASSDTATTPAVVATTTVTLGPEVATDAYRPSSLPATWNGYCPVASPSTVILTAGDAYQLVNKSGRDLTVVTVTDRAPVETVAAGATGSRHREYGAVSQPSFTFSLSVSGCTDGVSGQGLLNITVNSK